MSSTRARQPGKGGKGKLHRGGSATKSPYNRAERRERGFKLIAKGYTNVAIAKELGVHPDTVTRLRRAYEDQLQNEAAANPHLLHDVLPNTIRQLGELDLIRSEAWELHDRDVIIEQMLTCPGCDEEHAYDIHLKGKPEAKAQALRILLNANEQKAKLYQLLGVKAEFLAHVNEVSKLQARLIGFMRDHLCEADRRKLEDLLGTMSGAVDSTSTLAELEPPAA